MQCIMSAICVTSEGVEVLKEVHVRRRDPRSHSSYPCQSTVWSTSYRSLFISSQGSNFVVVRKGPETVVDIKQLYPTLSIRSRRPSEDE